MREVVSVEYAFTFGQVMVFDRTEEVGLAWEDAHQAQGFVRTGRAVHVALHGDAVVSRLRVFVADELPAMTYDAAVSTPIEFPSGWCVVCAPDDREGVRVRVEPGLYRLYVGQAMRGGESRVEVVLVRPDPIEPRSFIHTERHPRGEPTACREDARPADPA